MGRTLANSLTPRTGYEVKGNDIVTPSLAYTRLEPHVEYLWRATEDLVLEDLEGSHIVINCAAQADRPLGLSSPIYTLYTNLIPLAHLLELCTDLRRLQKFLHPGSGTAYIGLPENQLPATEATTPQPKNPYSASKYMQDILCQSYYYSHGLPVVTMRSGMVVGVPMRLDICISRWVAQALRGEPLVVYGPDVTRTPTDGRDVLKYWKAIIATPSEKVVGRIFHTVYPTSVEETGAEYSVMEMAQMVQNMVNPQSEIVITEPELGETVAGRPAREWIISTTAEELGVVPQFTLRDSITDIAHWLEKELL